MVQDENPAGSTIIDQNIATAIALQTAEIQALTRHQRAIEKAVAIIAVPRFLYGVLVVILIWVGLNLGLIAFGHRPLDEPPFGGLQTFLTVVALLMTTIVLITQNRQGKAADINEHLHLQIELLVDQKAAKIIQLLEEMRRDMPNVRDRVDAEAEELQIAIDPGQVAATIAEQLASEFVEEQEAEVAADTVHDGEAEETE